MTQEFVMAVSSIWDRDTKVDLLKSLLQADWSLEILYLGPLNILIEELQAYQELTTERLHLMTYQSFLRKKKGLDMRNIFVVLDEFSFCLAWGRHPESFLYEALHEISLHPLTCLALARKSHWREQFSWVELGFCVREVHYSGGKVSVEQRSSPWAFMGDLLKAVVRGKRVGLYCRSSRACRLWRVCLGRFPFLRLDVFSRELIYKRTMKERGQRLETFFLCSPLNQEELSFLFSRTCGRDFPREVYAYHPFLAESGKREKNVLKSVTCKQKWRGFSSPKDLFKSATWWAHSC